ncbi:hypothetical protein DNTS_035751 [Danionella cerebrum]|nr:hypothetical protein DNTS_035751 [Danionella translucida]
MDECEASEEVLYSDTMDQYRTFQMCERLLHHPAKLANQLLFQIPPDRQAMLIERYYAFDDLFVREVLGKKLSKGTKKDLDDTGKKKLQYLSFQDFAFCAGQLINHWTLGAVDNLMEDMDVDLDKEFLQDLKDLKILITDKDLLDQHKSLVCTALRGKTSAFNEMEANFKNLSRGLVNIAAKLINAKDVRDFFIDLVEKFIEPCRSDKWTSTDVNLYLTHYTNSAHILDTFK